MTWRRGFALLCGLLGGVLPGGLVAKEDPGKTVMGNVSVKVFYATDGDATAAGPKATTLEAAMEQRLRNEVKLRFKHYRALGEDIQPLFRSYENWAQPLRPSDEVLVRFEARTRPSEKSTRLDLELWLSRKKILKTDVLLAGDRPLLVLGPEWRGGRLIVVVSLAAAPPVR
jgi:hypothetical protein